MGQISQITSVIGRREALRCARIGVVAATGAAVLAACGGSSGGDGPGKSVKAQALAAFAVGTWHITFPLDDKRKSFTVTVTKTGWKTDSEEAQIEPSAASGTWKLEGGTVKVTNWGGSNSSGVATGAPARLGDTTTTHTIPWTYTPTEDSVSDDTVPLRFEWKPPSTTMTIHAVDANEEPLLIRARKA